MLLHVQGMQLASGRLKNLSPGPADSPIFHGFPWGSFISLLADHSAFKQSMGHCEKRVNFCTMRVCNAEDHVHG